MVDNLTVESLYPVGALKTYVARTQSLRLLRLQLFTCYGRQGDPVSKECLSHWVVETISKANDQLGLPQPHSTISMATSWALLRGVAVAEICSAA